MIDTTRREYLLQQAVLAGKFGTERAAFYREMYDRNPAATEQVLAALAPVPRGAGPFGHSDGAVQATEDAGRALVQPGRRSAPAAPAAAVREPVQAERLRAVEQPPTDMSLTPENVARWSAELFPETRAEAGARQGRVTSDQTYRRSARA